MLTSRCLSAGFGAFAVQGDLYTVKLCKVLFFTGNVCFKGQHIFSYKRSVIVKLIIPRLFSEQETCFTVLHLNNGVCIFRV